MRATAMVFPVWTALSLCAFAQTGDQGGSFQGGGSFNAGAAAPAALDPMPTARSANATAGQAGSGKLQSVTPSAVAPQDRTLSNSAGQVWREYDISSYTARITTKERPQQAIIDWILRETGTELWFSEPLGILSADRSTLRCYHTPEVQEIVANIVNLFVNNETESHAFGVRLVTVGSPNWRSKLLPMMRSVPVQSPGLDAWLVTKESAAIILAELRKRSDYKEHSAPNLLIHNGQPHILSSIRPRSYVRSAFATPNVPPGYQLEMGQVEEGYSLEICPLIETDGSTADVVLKCQVDQVERFVPIAIDIPGVNDRTKLQIQIPQITGWKLHERFRWPTSHVLVLSRGVVASPSTTPAQGTIAGVTNPFSNDNPRADALLFLSSNGVASQTLVDPQRAAQVYDPNTRGRY
jgi:hypothetical protein